MADTMTYGVLDLLQGKPLPPPPSPGVSLSNFSIDPFPIGQGVTNGMMAALPVSASGRQIAAPDPANRGATAIPGNLDASSGPAAFGADPFAPPPGMDGNQARAMALMMPPYNMTPEQVGQIWSQAQSRANTAAALQKAAIAGGIPGK